MNRLIKQSWGAVRRIAFGYTAVAVAVAIAFAPATAVAQTSLDLARLSIEELGEIEITSVSKRPQPLSEAAAAVFVISHEDIRRSGARSVPEILRLAPNLQVARIDSNQYAITARGFNGANANKLLVLIDGRSVYTPLFSGVFWNLQEVLPEDIERIEVISGPGGTLWGSNAVNGVINIITRRAQDTQGTLVSVGGGNDGGDAAIRHGGRLGENTSYRLTARGYAFDHTVTPTGASQQDAWGQKDVQFRLDWGQAADTLMLSARAYDGSIDQPVLSDKKISGGHLLALWNRQLADGGALQVQAYYDRTDGVYPGFFGEVLDTYDLDAQHRFALGTRHDIVWGGGYRLMRDNVDNIGPQVVFLPAQRDLRLANFFVQDSIALGEDLTLTLGGKLERNSYTGTEFQPNVRLAWSPADNALLWSAISRAVRTPARYDRDTYVPTGIPAVPFWFRGNPNFRSEKLIAYEIGYRMQPSPRSSFSISTFYNVYDDLRTYGPAPGPSLPFSFYNKMDGTSWGVELWGAYSVNDNWRLSAGYNHLKQNLSLHDPFDTITRFGLTDPAHQFSLRSAMNLDHGLEFDIALRAVSAIGSAKDSLPRLKIPGYAAVDANLNWAASKQLDVSLTGSNLFDKRHKEFETSVGRADLGRSVFVKILWKF